MHTPHQDATSISDHLYLGVCKTSAFVHILEEISAILKQKLNILRHGTEYLGAKLPPKGPYSLLLLYPILPRHILV